MPFRRPIFPIELILVCFRRDRSPNHVVVLAVVTVSILQALLVMCGAYLDGTWRLPDGIGFRDHYGAWATIVTDPLLVFATGYAYRQFLRTLDALPAPTRQDSTEIRRTMRTHLAFIRLKGDAILSYFALVAVGLLSWLNNIRQTFDPITYFGHDVYDAVHHVYGSSAHKFMLFISWVLIYPAVGFVIVALCCATRTLLLEMRAKGTEHPNITHPDGCYGLSELGSLNVWLLVPFFLAFTVIFAVLVTHERTYASAELPLLALSVLFVAASYVTIKPLVSYARSLRRRAYQRLASRSAMFGAPGDNSDLKFAIERLCFGTSTASPWSRTSRVMLLAMRLTPIILTTVKFYSDHFR